MPNAREFVKSLLPRSLRNQVRYAMWSHVDSEYRRETGKTGFPPAFLRVRVHGSLDIPSFIKAGEVCTRDILSALRSVSKTPKDIKTVLDFGCGSGRTLVALHRELPLAELYGTDTDPDAIKWSREHLYFGTFDVNSFEPPLKYPDSQFDLIYAISVFTHIDERLQDLWLAELSRIAKPGGIVLLTVHGKSVAESGKLDSEQLDSLDKSGILFVKDQSWSDLFPDFYQTTYHTREYIDRHLSNYFTIVGYIDQGMDSYQDLVILQAKPR